MIISHENKFIFIKTEKTAGTSIEIALSKHCGPHDIITPISPEDEAIRRKLGYRGPQNYSIPFYKYSKRDLFRFIRHRKRLCFYNHISAFETAQYVDQKIWDSYFKFCFERNPWDKVISWYFWRYKTEPRPALSEFIQSREAEIIKGYDLYTIDSKIVVDRVFFYENLSESLEELREQLQLDAPLLLPVAKTRFREDKRHYEKILSEPDKEKIAEIYAKEIIYFKYKW